jgi:hypothetical protein
VAAAEDYGGSRQIVAFTVSLVPIVIEIVVVALLNYLGKN